MKRRNPNWAKRVSGAGLAVGASAALFGAQGCLDRPVVPIEPQASQLIAQRIRVTRVDKLDLLLVVDNSISMADKQSELGRRIPELVAALTDPTPDPKTGKPNNVLDMHIGVISSSMGSHGTSACAPDVTNPRNNDKAHLLPRAGEGGGSGWAVGTDGNPTAATCPAPVAATALSWVFDPAKDPKAMFNGAGGAKTLETAASCVVQSVKDDGCGYEETWEAAYHFLVDPAPYTSADVKCTFGVSGDACGANRIEVAGLDEELLAQRAAFLRPDSLLAVLVLSDENDFSLKPAGLNWLPWGYGKGQMQRGWGACANVPDEFEPETPAEFARLHDEFKCFSCFENSGDPNCKLAWAADPLNNDVDGRNLRGFNQVQRFGYNFLYGRQRYVDAFSRASLTGADGKPFANPVFKGGIRDPNLVVVAGIVGVPKTLVSNEDGTPKTLATADWDKIVGPIGTRDPHMIESLKPRDGVPKFAGDRTVDAINGGDRDIPDGDDLQYACIAPRATTDKSNDCEGTEPEKKNPLCEAGGTQPFFKAYPGLRHLRIIKDLGASGFVASICNNSFRPAIVGITEKLKAALNAQCLNSVLPAAEDGTVNCLILESLKEDTNVGKRCEDLGPGVCTPGAEPCRVAGSDYPPTDPVTAAKGITLSITVTAADGTSTTEATTATSEDGVNVFVTGSDGKKHQVCEVAQIARIDAAAGQSCVNDPAFSTTTVGGWCYSTKPEVVGEQCIKRNAPSTIRFFGAAEPRNGSEVFTLCVR